MVMKQTSFRPLYRGLFSIGKKVRTSGDWRNVFVPFIGDFFQSGAIMATIEKSGCFRPLYRGLFSIRPVVPQVRKSTKCFRPLYRGLFSIGNVQMENSVRRRFRPLYRGLFSIFCTTKVTKPRALFSSPLSGTFFNRVVFSGYYSTTTSVFVPFIGDFFQSPSTTVNTWDAPRFRPLYRGLFSIPWNVISYRQQARN